MYEIAKISDGGMRDSINFLDQLRSFTQGNITIDDVYAVCGNVSLVEMTELLSNIKSGKLEQITAFLENLNNNGKNYGKFLEDLMMYLKDLILYKKNVSSTLIKTDTNYLSKLGDIYSIKDIFYIVDIINGLVDKIKFVSRQSVVVITNFLLMANKFSSVNVDDEEKNVKSSVKEVKNEEYGLAFKFTSNDKTEEKELTVNHVSDNIVKKHEYKEKVIKNKDVIINNAFALADKKLKLTLQEKWSSLKDYLTDNHYGMVCGKWTDVSLEVVGGNYIIFTVLYESLVDGIYTNERLSNDFINMLFGDNYHYVVITNEEWNNYKNEYIDNIKNGRKYQLKELTQYKDEISEKKETTIVDKLFDIVGEENIEFK